MKSLSKGVAIVTGASRGIGAAIARRLSHNGIALGLIGRDVASLEQVRSSLKNVRNAISIKCDVQEPDQIADAVEKISKSLGMPTILVNNAGIGGPFHRLDEVGLEEWNNIFFTNVRAGFVFCKLLLPQMKKMAHGRIINIASIQAHIGAERSTTYVASKHALIGYTKAIASEWGKWGVTCNAVSPGYVRTGMGLMPKSKKQDREFIKKRIPAGRLATPDEIAHCVSFLASQEASYINGSTILIDGGLLADLGFRP